MYNVRNADGSEYGPADLDTIVQWTREGRIAREALLIPVDGGEAISVFAVPRLASILDTPPTIPEPLTPPDDPLSGMIPYKNPPALIGYYIGLFSCFPFIGIIVGPMAIVLGIKGLRRRKKDPRCKGSAHAWIAIITGIIGTLFGLLFTVAIIFAYFDSP
ncbi:MAG: DUF4190 domain-containing protein [Planctomycetota bacterium]|nr:DUF4190 domain-containing protein [Planctomycetota bacterium]